MLSATEELVIVTSVVVLVVRVLEARTVFVSEDEDTPHPGPVLVLVRRLLAVTVQSAISDDVRTLDVRVASVTVEEDAVEELSVEVAITESVEVLFVIVEFVIVEVAIYELLTVE
jgi:hypothetical protein